MSYLLRPLIREEIILDTHTFAHALGKVNGSHDKVSKKSTALFRPFRLWKGAKLAIASF